MAEFIYLEDLKSDGPTVDAGSLKSDTPVIDLGSLVPDLPMQRSHETFAEQTPYERVAVSGSAGQKARAIGSEVFNAIRPDAVMDRHAGRRFERSAARQRFIGENIVQPIEELIGTDASSNYFLDEANKDAALAKQINERTEKVYPVTEGTWQGALKGAVDSIDDQLPGIVAGGITASGAIAAGAIPRAATKAATAISLIPMGENTGALSYEKYRQRGVGAGGAIIGSGVESAIEMTTELLPAGKLFEMMEPAAKESIKKLVKLAGQHFAGEQLGESLATLGQDVTDKFFSRPDMTTEQRLAAVNNYFKSGEATKNWLDTMRTTAVQSILMEGGVGAANRARQKVPAPDVTDINLIKGTDERNEIAAALREQSKPIASPAPVEQRPPEPIMDSEAATPEDQEIMAMQQENELYRQQQLMDRADIPVIQEKEPEIPTSFRSADGKSSVRTKRLDDGTYEVSTTSVDEYGNKKTFAKKMTAKEADEHINKLMPEPTRDEYLKVNAPEVQEEAQPELPVAEPVNPDVATFQPILDQLTAQTGVQVNKSNKGFSTTSDFQMALKEGWPTVRKGIESGSFEKSEVIKALKNITEGKRLGAAQQRVIDAFREDIARYEEVTAEQQTQDASVEAELQAEREAMQEEGGDTSFEFGEQPQEPQAEDGIRRGEIGGKLASGEVVLTASGRPTTPFPKIDGGSNLKVGNTLKRVDKWLMDNAIAEAESRGDEFNLQQFQANRDKPSQADKDSAEMYLFGDEQPAVPKPFLKPLVPKPLMEGDQSKLFPTPPTFGKKPQGKGSVTENPMLTEMKEREAESQQDAIPFSKKGKVSGLESSVIAKELKPLTSRLKDAYSVEVVQSERDLPQNVQDQIRSENVEGQVEGVYEPTTNRVFLVADNLSSLERAEEVLKHELVHKGIGQVFGKKLNLFLDQIAAERKLSNRRAAEEFIAESGEKYKGQGAVKRFIAKARQLLREMGFKVEFSDNDILSIAGKAMEEMGAIHRDGARFAAAWHGTPHDFDKFSVEAIGTGEGAQAYGYGLYFAGSRGVAEWYKERLSRGVSDFNTFYDGLASGINEEDYSGNALGFNDISWTKDQAREYLNKHLDYVVNDRDYQNLRDAYKKLKADEKFINSMVDSMVDPENDFAFDIAGAEFERVIGNKGRLYKVELAPQEDEYMRWDKPLSEQSEKIRNAIEQFYADIHKKSGANKPSGYAMQRINEMRQGRSGKGLYGEVSQHTGSDKAASDYLHSLGIRGIKYPDGPSRNRPIKDIKRSFLNALPEDAEFSDVTELIGSGTFTPEQEALLKALEKDDWLGFDYPAQAISAALGNRLSDFDPNQELLDAVAELSKDLSYNYVIFNDEDVQITAKFSLKDQKTAAKERAHSVLDSLKAFVNNPGGLGKLPSQLQYLARRYRVLGTISEINDLTADWGKAFKGATKEDNAAIYDYLTTKDADPLLVPEKFRKKAVEGKQMVIDIGEKLVAYGILSESVFEKNKGEYLPRVYLKFLIGEDTARVLGTGKKLDLNYLKSRKDIPEDVRRLILGEVKDPGFLLAKAFSIPSRDMALIDWLATISQNQEWVMPKSLIEWSMSENPSRDLGRINYRQNDDGTYNLTITEVKTVETKHKGIKTADLQTFLGNDKIAAYIAAGKGKPVLRKTEVNGKPVYKPTPWKKVGRIQYKTEPDGTMTFKLKERVTSKKTHNNVTDSQLDQLAGKRADGIRAGEGKVENSQVITPWHLAAEADRLQKQIDYMPAEDRKEAEEVARRMRKTADAAIADLPISPSDVPENFKQIPDSPKYGALRGLIVRREIYDDIVGSVNVSIGDQSAMEKLLGSNGTVSKLTGMWKWSKVAANPPAQVRNFVSNMVLLDLSGVNTLMVPVRIAQAAKEIASNGKHWQIAKSYGVKEATFSNTEMVRINEELVRILAKDKAGWTQIYQWAKFLASWGVNRTSDLYQFMESVGKTAKIIDEMTVKRNHGTFSKPDVRVSTAEEAAMEAHKWLFDYSLVSRNTKYLRNAPIGVPFMTFLTKIAPRLIEVAVKKPWRFTPYATLAYGLPYWIAGMLDIDDDDYEKIMAALPEWIREKQHVYLLPWKDEQGRWQAMDLGYYFPWTAWTTMGEGVYEFLSNEKDFSEASSKVGQGLSVGGPLSDLIAASKTGIDPFTQRKIVDKHADPSEQVAQVFGYLYQMAMPPFLTQRGTAGKLYSALTNELGKDRLPKASEAQAALSAVGMNLYGYDASMTKAQSIKRMQFDVAELRRQAQSELSNPNLSETEKEELRGKFREKIQRMNNKILKYSESSTPKNKELLKRETQ